MVRPYPYMLACMMTLGAACAAHHASAQWVLAPGTGWVDARLYHHDTRRIYDEQGSIRTIFADGHAVTTSLYLTAAYGVLPGLDAWAQAPLHRLVFNDAGGDRLRTGPGDVRLFVRAGPALVGLPAVPLALRAGVKLPGGDFPVDAEIIPLGEGQRDWEVMVEGGYAFGASSTYAMGWLGYRWREPNAEAALDPGDEVFAFAALGGQVGALSWKLSAEGLAGRPWRIQGVRVPLERRQIVQVQPTLGIDVGPGTVEAGVRLPLAGRNLPAGPSFLLGYFVPLRF